MEEKKILNEEETGKVSGGRHYVKGSKMLTPEQKEELMKSSVSLDSLSRRELPKEYLTQVSGGMDDEEEEEDECPYCGGMIKVYYDFGEWVFYCSSCSRIIAGSDFWTAPDDDFDF